MCVRLKTFGIHLLISVLIALAVVALVFGIWYPAPLAAATGVTSIFLILLVVDVCLGPLLTLVVYKPGKKTLAMDLTVIALLQIAALGYGLFTVAEGRPAWIVFSVDRFDLVRINDIDERKLNEAQSQYQQPSWFGPQWVAAINPDNHEERNILIFEAVLGGVDISARPNYYQSLEYSVDNINKRALTLKELEKFNSNAAIAAALKGIDETAQLRWLPLKANARNMVVLVDEQGKVVKAVNLRPW